MNVIKRAIRGIAANDLLWRFVDGTLLKVADHLTYHRSDIKRAQESERVNDFVRSMTPQLKVIHGLFSGMVYPSVEACGSAVVPKFIGSYERELGSKLDSFVRVGSYERVVDVGAAEGYYAVGLARVLSDAIVYAYDIDPNAQQMCKELAEINGVSDRVHVEASCDSLMLADVLSCKRALLIMDCEGAEEHLLTPQLVDACKNHTVIVELHDDLAVGVSETIESMFALTHRITSVSAVYDAVKARTYDYAEIRDLSFEDRRWALAENRSTGIEWFVIEPKNASCK